MLFLTDLSYSIFSHCPTCSSGVFFDVAEFEIRRSASEGKGADVFQGFCVQRDLILHCGEGNDVVSRPSRAHYLFVMSAQDWDFPGNVNFEID